MAVEAMPLSDREMMENSMTQEIPEGAICALCKEDATLPSLIDKAHRPGGQPIVVGTVYRALHEDQSTPCSCFFHGSCLDGVMLGGGAADCLCGAGRIVGGDDGTEVEGMVVPEVAELLMAREAARSRTEPDWFSEADMPTSRPGTDEHAGGTDDADDTDEAEGLEPTTPK